MAMRKHTLRIGIHKVRWILQVEVLKKNKTFSFIFHFLLEIKQFKFVEVDVFRPHRFAMCLQHSRLENVYGYMYEYKYSRSIIIVV